MIERDDRVLPLTRIVATAVFGILVAAWFALFLHPDETETRFAWTIDGTMTPMLMGAGYGSAAYFYARVLTGRRWHRVSLGFLPTIPFVWLLLAATLLHWDRFSHGTPAFRLWFWVYLATPVLVPLVWARNRRHDPGLPDPDDPPVPAWARTALWVAGIAMVVIAAFLFVVPTAAIEVWPWPLTPLTSRAVSAFVALPGVAWLAIATDGRWSAARTMLETVALGLAMLLVAVARAWDEFDHANPLSLVYLVGLAFTLVAIVAGYGWMEVRRRRTAA